MLRFANCHRKISRQPCRQNCRSLLSDQEHLMVSTLAVLISVEILESLQCSKVQRWQLSQTSHCMHVCSFTLDTRSSEVALLLSPVPKGLLNLLQTCVLLPNLGMFWLVCFAGWCSDLQGRWSELPWQPQPGSCPVNLGNTGSAGKHKNSHDLMLTMYMMIASYLWEISGHKRPCSWLHCIGSTATTVPLSVKAASCT